MTPRFPMSCLLIGDVREHLQSNDQVEGVDPEVQVQEITVGKYRLGRALLGPSKCHIGQIGSCHTAKSGQLRAKSARTAADL